MAACLTVLLSLASALPATASQPASNSAASQRKAGSRLAQQGVKETIMLGVGQQRPGGQRFRERATFGVLRVARQERLHLPVVLFMENRAGGVKQCTTRGQQSPKRLQNNGLLRGKLSDVVRAPQPLDVGIAAHHAGRAARHVGEDAVV